VSARARRFARALREFLAGFVGATPRARCAHEARDALAHRASRRGTCC
jgi:hypothetical protein